MRTVVLTLGVIVLVFVLIGGVLMATGAVDLSPDDSIPTPVPAPDPSPVPAQYISIDFEVGSPWQAESYLHPLANLWITKVYNGDRIWEMANLRIFTAEASPDNQVLLVSGIENNQVGHEMYYLISINQTQPWRTGQIYQYKWWNESTIIYSIRFELVGTDYYTISAWSPTFNAVAWNPPYGSELIGFFPQEFGDQISFDAYFRYTYHRRVTWNPYTVTWTELAIQ